MMTTSAAVRNAALDRMARPDHWRAVRQCWTREDLCSGSGLETQGVGLRRRGCYHARWTAWECQRATTADARTHCECKRANASVGVWPAPAPWVFPTQERKRRPNDGAGNHPALATAPTIR